MEAFTETELVPATVSIDGLRPFPALIERDRRGRPARLSAGGFASPLFDRETMLEVVDWAARELPFADGDSISYDARLDAVVETLDGEAYTTLPDERGLYRAGLDWIWTEG